MCRVNTNQNLDISSSSVKMIDSFLMLVCLAVALLHVVMVTKFSGKVTRMVGKVAYFPLI